MELDLPRGISIVRRLHHGMEIGICQNPAAVIAQARARVVQSRRDDVGGHRIGWTALSRIGVLDLDHTSFISLVAMVHSCHSRHCAHAAHAGVIHALHRTMIHSAWP
ncbi:hypothetical protein D3C86_1454990 [compost metagenome]